MPSIRDQYSEIAAPAPATEATAGTRILDFLFTIDRPEILTPGFSIMDPFQQPVVQQVASAFYTRFYNDATPRLFLFGINPGRFGAGITGIPFTDPWALREKCGIESTLTGQRELSSEFIYLMIDRYGGAESFWRDCYVGAVFPFALIKGEKNINYYDDRALQTELTPFIVDSLHRQIAFGARRDIGIVIGTGKNYAYLSRLNAEHRFFERLIPIDHPRFIMQYRRKRLDEYLDRYVTTIHAALNGGLHDSVSISCRPARPISATI